MSDRGRMFLHIPWGFIVTLAFMLSGAFGFGVLASFLCYEIDEDWGIRDGAWRDIKGLLVGLIIGVLGWAALRVARGQL